MLFIDGLILAVDDLLGDSEGVSSAERLGKGHKLVDDAAKCPDISFLSVWL